MSSKSTAPSKPAPETTAPKAAAAKKPAVKSTKVSKPAVKTVKPVKAEKPVKVEKPKKAKLVRDSFTIPKAEYDLLAALKTKAVTLKQPAKKSELLRAGVKLLAGLSDADFLSALQAVPALKTGRPKSAPVAATPAAEPAAKD